MFKILSDFFWNIIEKISGLLFFKKVQHINMNEINKRLPQEPALRLQSFISPSEFFPIKLKPVNIEYNCMPKKDFKNSDSENEKMLSVLPPEMWISIFSFLSVPKLCNVMTICKFFGEITNERQFREAFYNEKMNRVTRVPRTMFFSQSDCKLNLITNQVENHMPTLLHSVLSLREDILEQPGEQGYTLKRPSL